jgi:hypothetical protein
VLHVRRNKRGVLAVTAGPAPAEPPQSPHALWHRCPDEAHCGQTEQDDVEAEADAKTLSAAQFAADVKRLGAAAGYVKQHGFAVDAVGGGFNGGLDLLVDNPGTTSALVATFCNGNFFLPPLYGQHWKVRIHLLDGSISARCTIQ